MSIWAVRTGKWVEFRSAPKKPTIVKTEALFYFKSAKLVQEVVEGGRLLLVAKYNRVVLKWGGINLSRGLKVLNTPVKSGAAVEVPTEIAQPLLKSLGYNGRIKIKKAVTTEVEQGSVGA